MNATTRTAGTAFHGTDRLLFGMILGVVTFWLSAQTTLNIAPRIQDELAMREAAIVAQHPAIRRHGSLPNAQVDQPTSRSDWPASWCAESVAQSHEKTQAPCRCGFC